MNKLFGDIKLQRQDDLGVETQSISGDGKVVGLYFSAHWCPPCRAFTPQLAEWYKNIKKTDNGENFEIVFISSDKDDKSFKEYYETMPWLALPFSYRDKKTTLSKKFKVSGIPTLVMLDTKTGKMISADGRSIVMDDKEGKEFPWAPKKFLDIIPGKLIGKDSEKKWDDVEAEFIGVYFSAHWCGPCRGFTPRLVQSYDQLKSDGKSFEIIFVSSDKDEDAMKEYFKEMPWLAIPYNDSRKKNLSRLFEVSGIPTLVILEKTGNVITTSARSLIANDPQGKDFPYYPKPVSMLSGVTAGEVNDKASLIWFFDDENSSKEDSKTTKVVKALTDVAVPYLDKVKEEDKPEVTFLYLNASDDEDDIGASLKSFANIPKREVAVLLDIPNQQIHICESTDVNGELIKKLVADYADEKLEFSNLRE